MFDMGRLVGRQTTTFYAATDSISVPFKHDQEKTQSLLDMTKSLTPPCNLGPLISNSHVQTICTLMDKGPDIHFKRHVFESDSTAFRGTFAVDFVVPTPQQPEAEDPDLPPRTTFYTEDQFQALGSDDEKNMLFILHGITGYSGEAYVKHALKPLVWDLPEEERWEACVPNARGCGMSKLTTGCMYNVRTTWDMRQTIRWARERWPRRKLFAMGFSLGANLLLNYLGEEGAECLLDGAISVSNPWNLELANWRLESSFIGRQYSKAMAAGLRNVALQAKDVLARDNPNIDWDEVEKIAMPADFDRLITCPTFGWPTPGAYYRDGVAIDALMACKVPLLIVHARGDPISCGTAVFSAEVKKTPTAVIVETSGGGHLGWFENLGARWYPRLTTAWLTKMANDVDLDAMRETRLQAAHANGHLGGPKAKYTPITWKLGIAAPAS